MRCTTALGACLHWESLSFWSYRLAHRSAASKVTWALFHSAGATECANKAGTLLFLRLLFADEMQGSQGPLFALGAVSLVGQAALATHVQRQQAVKQLKRRTSAVPKRFRRAAVELASGKRSGKLLTGLACMYCGYLSLLVSVEHKQAATTALHLCIYKRMASYKTWR